MALAEHRPMSSLTATVASPSFKHSDRQLSEYSSASSTSSKNASSLSPSPDSGEDLRQSLISFNPPKSGLRSISPESLVNIAFESAIPAPAAHISPFSDHSSQPSALKKIKGSSRTPIATGVSTTIPVTGEKPRPDQSLDSAFDDNVLYAIFLILYESDPQGQGMTVKQICDVLISQHPEMANLSTKTSNLVSAKLNAYVKRVEKGDSSLKYALSRDWADALPKRMVYVYRGLLAKDYHLHVQNVAAQAKNNSAPTDDFISPCASPEPALKATDIPYHEDSLHAAKQAAMSKHRRLTVHETGFHKSMFLETPLDRLHLFVPYLLAPVAASLTERSFLSSRFEKPGGSESENEFEVFGDEEEEEEDDDDIIGGFKDFDIEVFHKDGKRSKSMSYLANSKKSKVVTAAAAAPRASRSPLQHLPNAAAAAAALHAAALRAIPSHQSPHKKWLSVVDKGFLTQDIGQPEDLSLLDLDKFFN